MLSDLRFVLRALVRQRAFSLVTILTLALGMGAAASIFSVTDWVLFKANRYPSDVFLIGGNSPDQPLMPIRFDFMVRAYEQRPEAVAEFGKAASMSGNVVIGGVPVRTGWLGMTPNLFSMIGVNVARGRGFLPGEDVAGADQVVVVSHWFWQKELGGAENVLGRKIILGDAVCTIVGVLGADQTMPPFFWNDIYRPLAYKPDPGTPWLPNLFVLGRLRPGVTREQATAILAAAAVDYPPMMRGYLEKEKVALASLPELNQFFRAEIYWVMVGAVGFLYGIACLNASNLMLVRMLGQRRELSIRLALGGGRWRVIRLLVLESLVLSVVASLLGALVANWIFPLLLSAAGGSSNAVDWTSWTLGPRVLAVLALLSVLSGLLTTVVPAWRILRTDIYAGLKEGGAALGESRGVARVRGLFVVLQAAFALILLAGAGLMIRTFQNLQKVDLGFDPARKAKVHISLPPGSYMKGDEWEAALLKMRSIQAELARVPGVQAVGFGQDILLPGFYYSSHTLEGPGGKPVKAQMAGFNIGYQEASGLRLKRGRWLNQSRGNEVMVNESLARACWPGQDPVGQLLRPTEGNPSAEKDWKGWVVAGVVGDVRSSMRDAPNNYLYSPEGWGSANLTTFVVLLGRDYDEAWASLIKRRLYAFDPRIVVDRVVPVGELQKQQLWAEQMANSVLKVLAGIALVLTVVGVFSVLAYTVDRRMGEFGVRMALGATRGDLLQLVMVRGMALTLGGIVVGVGGSLALSRSMRSLLFEVSPQSPAVLALVGGLLLLVSAAGCFVPALRATKVDVTKLLRTE